MPLRARTIRPSARQRGASLRGMHTSPKHRTRNTALSAHGPSVHPHMNTNRARTIRPSAESMRRGAEKKDATHPPFHCPAAGTPPKVHKQTKPLRPSAGSVLEGAQTALASFRTCRNRARTIRPSAEHKTSKHGRTIRPSAHKNTNKTGQKPVQNPPSGPRTHSPKKKRNTRIPRIKPRKTKKNKKKEEIGTPDQPGKPPQNSYLS